MSVNTQRERLRIVKIGGRIINDGNTLDLFLQDFAGIKGNKILVHGGGRVADDLLKRLGLQPKYHQGRRITDTGTLDVVVMTYAGLINKSMVARLQQTGCNAIGLTGADGNIIHARKRPAGEIDYGYVGDVTGINPEPIVLLLGGGMVPVFCALTHDREGMMLNTNADTIAAELGTGLSGFYNVELLYCFEKAGVLNHAGDESGVYPELSRAMYGQAMKNGELRDGILPKLDNAFRALERGVAAVWITSYRNVSREIPAGTRIVL